MSPRPFGCDRGRPRATVLVLRWRFRAAIVSGIVT